MKPINPENRVVDAVADAIGSVVLRKLYYTTQAEGTQSRVVKGGGTSDVRNSDASMVDHDDSSLVPRIANRGSRRAGYLDTKEPFRRARHSSRLTI
jgi:hypothetical protein